MIRLTIARGVCAVQGMSHCLRRAGRVAGTGMTIAVTARNSATCTRRGRRLLGHGAGRSAVIRRSASAVGLDLGSPAPVWAKARRTVRAHHHAYGGTVAWFTDGTKTRR